MDEPCKLKAQKDNSCTIPQLSLSFGFLTIKKKKKKGLNYSTFPFSCENTNTLKAKKIKNRPAEGSIFEHLLCAKYCDGAERFTNTNLEKEGDNF